MNDEIEYPGIMARMKGAIVDSVFILVMLIAASKVFALLPQASDQMRIGAFVFIFVLYDPLFTSFFGGTVGHIIANIKVKRVSDDTKNIMLPLAFIRFFIKVLLGWISLLTVNSSTKKQAIHDKIVGTVVLYRL